VCYSFWKDNTFIPLSFRRNLFRHILGGTAKKDAFPPAVPEAGGRAGSMTKRGCPWERIKAISPVTARNRFGKDHLAMTGRGRLLGANLMLIVLLVKSFCKKKF